MQSKDFHNRNWEAKIVAVGAIVLFGILLTVVSTRAAQAAVNIQEFSPAANSKYTWTEDAGIGAPEKGLFFSAHYNYVRDPLVELNEARTERVATVVQSLQTLDITAGWKLHDRLSWNFNVPVSLVGQPDRAAQFAMGDLRTFLKFRLNPEDSFVVVSLIPELMLPTGSSDLYLSNRKVGGGGRIAFERDFGPLMASINVGYRYSPDAQLMDMDYTHRLPVGLGLYVPLSSKFGVNAEGSANVTLPLNRFHNPGEIYLGGRYQATRDVVFDAGAAVGSFAATPGNNYRFIVGLRFAPVPEPAEMPIVVSQAAPAPEAARVTFTPTEIKITEEVKFEHGSAVLTTSGKSLLDEIATSIKTNQGKFKLITIEGHTNEIGTLEFNQTLSEQRAASVREYLESRGVLPNELETKGYGKTRPKALEGLPRQVRLEANRRVEFKVQQDEPAQPKQN